jgi:hypothetical protein
MCLPWLAFRHQWLKIIFLSQYLFISIAISCANMSRVNKAPWLSVQCQGLAILAMVLIYGFKSRLHLKNYIEKDGLLDCRKYNKNNKDSQIRQFLIKKRKKLSTLLSSQCKGIKVNIRSVNRIHFCEGFFSLSVFKYFFKRLQIYFYNFCKLHHNF